MTSQSPTLTVAVLTFRKPTETRLCLQSLHVHLKVPATIVLLDNGGGLDYPVDLYREGLCDVLIVKREGQGGGVGQTDLFRWADTPYTLFVQSDQVMRHDLTPHLLDEAAQLLDTGYQCIDFNGDQSNRGVWTDRAHLIKTDLFNSFAPFPNGGPGPRHADRWNENYLQQIFEDRQYRIAHIKPTLFADIGKWTVRENGGGLVRMRTDTKQVWWDAIPVRRDVFPDHTDLEWETVLAGDWPQGQTPDRYVEHAFKCWPDDMLND